MALELFWRVFSRLMRMKLIAVGIVFAGIAVILALLAFVESGYLPATGVVVSAEPAGKTYDGRVDVTRDGVTTRVKMELYDSKFGRPPAPGDEMRLLQSPYTPTMVTKVGLGSRLEAMAWFTGLSTIMLWLGFGARLPKWKVKVAVPVVAAPKSYQWQQAPESAPRARLLSITRGHGYGSRSCRKAAASLAAASG